MSGEEPQVADRAPDVPRLPARAASEMVEEAMFAEAAATVRGRDPPAHQDATERLSSNTSASCSIEPTSGSRVMLMFRGRPWYVLAS
jgi:hypothetical protein